MNNEDISYLENLPKDWWKSGDTVSTVATILDDYSCFKDTKSVIDYFEKPWKYRHDIDFLIKEFGE